MNLLKFWLPVACVVLTAFVVSCNKSSSDTSTSTSGNWTKRSQYNGQPRARAVSFVIGDIAYVGTGLDNTISTTYLKDFYKYDPTADSWTKIADFPGEARHSAVAFSIGTKAYVGTGISKDGTLLNDIWEYDQATNTWASKNPFGGTPRVEAIAFAVNGKGYIGTGTDNVSGDQKDMWEYNPADDSWTEIPFNGNKRHSALAFVHDNKAYVVTGTNNGRNLDDFFVFDPTLTGENKWKALSRISNASTESFDDDYTDIAREGGAAFIIGTKAYISTGISGGASLNNKTWEYNFATDRWTRKTDFELPARTNAVGFTVKGKGILGAGGGAGTKLYFDDFLEFQPDAVKIDNDNF